MDKVRRKTYLDKTDESYSLLNNDSLQMGRFFKSKVYRYISAGLVAF